MNSGNYFLFLIGVIKDQAQLFMRPLFSFFKMTNNKIIDVDKCIEWIENGISNHYLNYNEFNEFQNMKRIGSGAFGNVYKANWKNSNTVVALKSFGNDNRIIVNEVNIKCKEGGK